jgi:hypothetical protein
MATVRFRHLLGQYRRVLLAVVGGLVVGGTAECTKLGLKLTNKGGTVAQALTVAEPGLVRRLILVGTEVVSSGTNGNQAREPYTAAAIRLPAQKLAHCLRAKLYCAMSMGPQEVSLG